jgi:hypothetical protein
VARAKRTERDRAEARRRYRASIAAAEGETTELDDLEDGPTPGEPTPGARTSGPSERPSITAAFRSSFRPLDLRGDLRALPGLFRHKAFLIPLILAGAAVAVVPLVGPQPLAITFWQYFAGSAPLGTAFVAGFLAPRASWLIGGLVCLIAVGFQAIAFTGQFGGIFDNLRDVNNAPVDPATAKAFFLNQSLIIGVPSGMFFAAAAAWYKRFLNRANPNRSRPGPSGGRRPDGRQPKRNQGRPMLARRRQ